MVYTFMNYDDFNSKYNDILKIALAIVRILVFLL